MDHAHHSIYVHRSSKITSSHTSNTVSSYYANHTFTKSSTPAAAPADRHRLIDHMASLVSRPRRSVQMYWARRNYKRLGVSPSRHLKVVRLGGGSRTRTLGSGAAIQLRLRSMATLLLSSPARLLARLRNAYVDDMLALAAGGAAQPCAALATAKPGDKSALWGKRVPRARSTGARSSDFESRMMAHIYSTLLTPAGGAPRRHRHGLISLLHRRPAIQLVSATGPNFGGALPCFPSP